MARGSDYRRAAVKLPAVLRTTASTKVVHLVNTLAELSLLLYITEEDRSPRLILRLYNISFLHAIYCTEVLQPVKQLSPGVVFGLYFHKLTKHAAEETRCVSGYTRIAENEERVFKELRKLQVCTSGRPDEVAKQLMERIQIRESTTTNHSSFVKENRKLKLPSLRRDTVFTKNMLANHKDEIQLHMQRIADYLVCGPAVWWCKEAQGEAIRFFDGIGQANVRPEGPIMRHFRDTSVSEALQSVSECLEQCISGKVELPLNELRLQDGDNGRVRYVAWPPVEDHTAREEKDMAVNDIGETNSQGVRTRDTEDGVKATQQDEYYNDDCNVNEEDDDSEEEEEEEDSDSEFNIDHALSCSHGGYLGLRHNEVRDLLGELLDETCSNVCLEPVLKPIDGEQLRRSTNTADDARLDIKAGGFWSANRHECAYFDDRVFYPHAHSYRHRTLEQLYRSHEQDKRRDYEDRVRNVERGTFTPLVFSATGGADPAATTFLKRLADKVAEKRNSSYAQTVGWLRCRLSFALLRASLLCLRGSRQLKPSDKTELRQPDLAMVEACVSWDGKKKKKNRNTPAHTG